MLRKKNQKLLHTFQQRYIFSDFFTPFPPWTWERKRFCVHKIFLDIKRRFVGGFLWLWFGVWHDDITVAGANIQCWLTEANNKLKWKQTNLLKLDQLLIGDTMHNGISDRSLDEEWDFKKIFVLCERFLINPLND